MVLDHALFLGAVYTPEQRERMYTHDMNQGVVDSSHQEAMLEQAVQEQAAQEQQIIANHEAIAHRDGRIGMRPQSNDWIYLCKWAMGFAELVQEKRDWGLVPSMEWRQLSHAGRMHIEATNPDEGADCPF